MCHRENTRLVLLGTTRFPFPLADDHKRQPSNRKSLLLGEGLGRGGLGALLLLGQALLLGGLLGGESLGAVVLGHGLHDGLLVLGLDDLDGVGEGLGGAGLALGVGAAHDLDLDTKDTLAEENVAGGLVDEVLGGLAGVDHEAVSELHGLGTGSTELARDDDLATLGAGLHDEAEDTVAGTADGETVQQLVAEGLALSDGGQTAVLDLGGIQRDRVLGKLEALLDERGELADAATLLAEDLLGVGGPDDDVGDRGGNADLDAGVTLLSELALEELVELGVENTVCGEESAMHSDATSHMCAASWAPVPVLPEPPVPIIVIIVPARLQGS